MTREGCDQVEEAAAFALGSLTELENQVFERHLMGCETCARELREFRATVEALPVALPQYRAPAALKDEIMSTVRQDAARSLAGETRASQRRFGWRPSRRPALALGALATGALMLGSYGLGASLSEKEPQVVQAAVDPTHLPGARASLARADDVAVLRASGLRPLGARGVYVVWLDRGEGPVYVSSFNVRPDGSGQAGVPDVAGVRRIMVTREVSTAVRQPTERPVLTVDLT